MHTGSSLRWLLAILTVALLALLAGGAWFYISQEQELRQKAESDLQAIADLKVNQIVTWRAERLGDAAILTESPFFSRGLQDWLADRQNTPLADVITRLQSLKSNYAYYDVLLADPSGHVLMSLNGQLDLLEADVLQALADALQRRQPVMTDLHAGPDDLPPHLDILAPLFASADPASASIGVVVLRVDAARFLYPLIQSWPMPSPSAETLIVRQDGDSALFLNELRHQPGTALTLRIPLTETDVPAVMAVMGQRGVFQGQDYRGVEVLSAIAPIPDSPWFMIAKVDTAEILADWRFRSALILVLLLGFAAMLAGAVGMIWQRNRRIHYQSLLEAERARQESEARYEVTLLSIGDGIITTDIEGRVKLLNPVAETLTGWSQAEASGMPLEHFFRIVSEDTHQPVENPVSRVLNEGRVVGLANHTLLIARDGTEHPIADSGAPIRNASGEITGVVLVFRDQTQERVAERELREREAYIRTILDNLPVGVAVNSVDPTVTFSYMNENFVKIYRTTREALANPDTFWETVYEDTDFREIIRGRVLEDVASGDPERMHWDDVPITREGAETTYISARNVPIYGMQLMLSTVWDTTERKRAEEALQQSEERFRRAVDDAPLPMMIHAEDGEVVVINRVWTDITGYTHADLPTVADWTERAYGERKGMVEADIDRLYGLTERVAEGEYAIATRGGETRTWDFSSSPLGRLPDGRRLALSMAMDVTARKQAEAALRHSEERYRTVADFTYDWEYWRAPDGNLLYVSPSCERITGYSAQEFITHPDLLAAIVHPDDRHLLQQHALWAWADDDEQAVHTADYRIIRRDGAERWIGHTCQLIRNAEGTLLGRRATNRDITAHKQAEQTIRESEERYHHTLDAMLEGCQIIGTDWRYLYLNDAADKHNRRPKEELLGNKYMDMWPDIESTEVFAVIRRTMEALVPQSMENEFMFPDGSKGWFELRIYPVPEGIVILSVDITERKQAEAALYASEARYKSLFENNHAVMLLIDPASASIVDANPAACTYYGWSRAQLCAMRVDQINTLSPQKIAAEMQRAQREERNAFNFEHRLADGTLRDVEVYSGPIEVQDRSLLYSIVHDITERKQIERALQESEERLRLFIEHAPASLAMFDRDMRYLSVSRRWLADYHLGDMDLIGRSHYEVFPEVPERWKEIHRRGLAGEVLRAAEDEFVRADETVQWLSWEVRPWTTSDGAIGGIIVFSEDITERRAAEEEIRSLNAELEQRVLQRTAELSDLYNNAPCGYHSLNGDGVFEHVNDTELAWLGYTREELIGRVKATDLLTPASVQTFKQNFPLLKKRGWLTDLELDMVRKDGSILPVLLSATAVRDEDGRFLMSRSTMIDHTERHRIEVALQERSIELEASNKELEAFSYSVSHDLRAPLRAMDGFSRILSEDFAAELPTEARRFLNLIRENAQQMGSLIDHLLAFSRLGRQPLKRQKLAPDSLVRDALDDLHAERETRRVDVTIEALAPCRADPALLRQVFANLLGNAFKFTRQREQAVIRVGSRIDADGEPVYYIQDNGTGFDMQYANKLFGVFQRLHRAEDYEGSGVGLATVQRIIHRHGGRIWAEAEIDKGATFYFTLGKESPDES